MTAAKSAAAIAMALDGAICRADTSREYSGRARNAWIGGTAPAQRRYLSSMSTTELPGGVVHPLPADLRETLLSSSAALDAWSDITPLARNEFICWVEDAKQQQTRERRIRRTRGAKTMTAIPLAV